MAFFCSSYGQGRFGLGLENGVSFLKSGNELQDGFGFSAPLWSYSFSLGYEKKILNAFNLTSEIQFSRRGFSYKIKNYFEEDEISAKRTMKYLALNLIPSYSIFEKKKGKYISKLSFLSGFSISHIFDHKWKYAHQDKTDVSNNVKSFEGAFIIGSEFSRFKKGKKLYALGVRYYSGFSDISSSSEAAKMRNFTLRFSYPLFL